MSPAQASSEAAIVVLYKTPKDASAFERYCAGTHVPLVDKVQRAVGFTRAALQRFERAADGSEPMYYRAAALWFPSMAALERGMKTPEFKELAGDLGNFASGWQDVLLSVKTSD